MDYQSKIEKLIEEIREIEQRDPHFYDPPAAEPIPTQPQAAVKKRDVLVEVTRVRGGHGEWVPVVTEREV